MAHDAPERDADSEAEPRQWPAILLKSLRYVSWALFVYSTPGMLLVVLLVTAWLVPGVVVLLGLAVLQVPVYLLFRRLVRPREATPQGPNVDPRFAADYWSGCRSADFGSSRST